MEANLEQRNAVESIRAKFEGSEQSHIWKDYVNALRLVSQVVFTRSSGFVLEFIQNAEDAGQGQSGTGEVSISVNKQRLRFVHNGRPFDEENLRAICGIQSSKKPERGTLGYLGIGFKSAFKVADCVEVYSNGFQFKFDRHHPDWASASSETPWHVIPIWIDEPSEEIESDKTTFIVRLRYQSAHAHLMEGLEQIRAELYLFLKWIRRIQITDEASGKSWSLDNLGESSGITTLKQGDVPHRFKFFRHIVQVPESVKTDRLTQEYRVNVTTRAIAIAFAVNEQDDLDPSPSTAMYGGVYSFLPLGESTSGARFPIQADFLVQPGRDAINAECIWNHWLVKEVADLCKKAIAEFQQHEKWKYQYLAAFEFELNEGAEAHRELFGPELIQPIQSFLAETACVMTAEGEWAKLSDVVALDEKPEAAAALVATGILDKAEIAPVLGGKLGLKLVHPDVASACPEKFKQVNRWGLFDNAEFLNKKRDDENAATWFRKLYLWLQRNPVYEPYGRRPSVKRYHGKEFVLSADKKLLDGGKVSLLALGSEDPLIQKLAYELQQKKPMLHPDVLSGAKDENERTELVGFLTGFVGVQKMDAKMVCEEAVLPKIVSGAPKPTSSELLDYTKYCQQYLGSALVRGRELWALTKNGQIRTAKEVFFPTQFKPAQNWEIHQQYVKGLDFLSADYVVGCTDEQLKGWREFFRAGGVKDAPDNGVEVFAMNYAKTVLSSHFKNLVEVDKQNYGYDMAGEDGTGQKVHIEVKGKSADADVELTGNEATVAKTHGSSFYLCVVSGIPEAPLIYLVRDPDKRGDRDKLTVRTADWKACLLVQPSGTKALAQPVTI
jgi:hypothetical protein